MNLISQFYKIITDNKIVIFGNNYCPSCKKSIKLAESNHLKFYYVDINAYSQKYDKTPSQIIELLGKKTNNYKYIPIIFINQKFIGGFTDFFNLLEKSDIKSIK